MTDDFVNLEYAYKLHDTKNKKKIISKKSRREKRNSKIKFEQLREKYWVSKKQQFRHYMFINRDVTYEIVTQTDLVTRWEAFKMTSPCDTKT